MLSAGCQEHARTAALALHASLLLLAFLLGAEFSVPLLASLVLLMTSSFLLSFPFTSYALLLVLATPGLPRRQDQDQHHDDQHGHGQLCHCCCCCPAQTRAQQAQHGNLLALLLVLCWFVTAAGVVHDEKKHGTRKNHASPAPADE